MCRLTFNKIYGGSDAAVGIEATMIELGWVCLWKMTKKNWDAPIARGCAGLSPREGIPHNIHLMALHIPIMLYSNPSYWSLWSIQSVVAFRSIFCSSELPGHGGRPHSGWESSGRREIFVTVMRDELTKEVKPFPIRWWKYTKALRTV